MSIDEITTLLNIPYSTFKEWNTKGHKKYDLTLLLLSLDTDNAKSLISKQKDKLFTKPKYSPNTRFITLKKDIFTNDLFWTSKDKEKINIDNLIAVYMNRAVQIDTDTLCTLFGWERVSNIVQKHITDKYSLHEANRQIEYYKNKTFHTPFKLTEDELQNNYLKNPKQRVIDHYCKINGYDKVLEEASELKPKYPIYSTIKQMVDYFKKENLNDIAIKNAA